MKRALFTICLLVSMWPILFAQLPAEGQASYYNDALQGRPTASGEKYNKDAFTCAHRTLPFGTKLQVTNLKNGQSVIVKVNDRGPHTPNRILDLSRAAAEAIGLVQSGVAQVRIETANETIANAPVQSPTKNSVYLPEAPASQPVAQPQVPASAPTGTYTPTSGAPAPAQPSRPDIGYTPPPASTVLAAPQPQAGGYPPPPPPPLPPVQSKPEPLEESSSHVLSVTSPNPQPVDNQVQSEILIGQGALPATGYAIQVGAYRNMENAREAMSRVVVAGISEEQITVIASQNQELFRVLVGPFVSETDARTQQKELFAQKISGVVINLANL